MKYKYIAAALLVAIGFLPLYQATAQSSATTRAQEILNRNNARNVEILDRDAKRLQEIDDRLEVDYEGRLLAQVNASSQDIQATLFPFWRLFTNISDRLTNVVTVLRDLDIALAVDAATAQATGIEGLVAFDVVQKYENFLNCFDGTGNQTGCIVYEIPASGVELIDGLQPSSNQPMSASTHFIAQIEWIGGPSSVAPTTVGTGYTNHTTNQVWITGPFQTDYRKLRDEAFAAGAVLQIDQYVDCGRDNGTATDSECEFTDPESMSKAVQVQVDKLRTELSILEGTFINVRQSVRALIYDVLKALEFYQKTQDTYDPRDGNPSFTPTGRQGAQ